MIDGTELNETQLKQKNFFTAHFNLSYPELDEEMIICAIKGKSDELTELMQRRLDLEIPLLTIYYITSNLFTKNIKEEIKILIIEETFFCLVKLEMNEFLENFLEENVNKINGKKKEVAIKLANLKNSPKIYATLLNKFQFSQDFI